MFRQDNGELTRLCTLFGNSCFEREMAKAATGQCGCLLDCEGTSYGYSVTVEELKKKNYCSTRELRA